MIRKIRQGVLIFGDIIIAYLSLFLTVVIGFWGRFDSEVLIKHLFPFSLLYLSWLIIFYIFDLYNLTISKDRLLFYPRFFQAIATALVIGLAFFYLWPAFGITPKTNLILSIVFFSGFTLFWRRLFYLLFSKKLFTNIAILGNGPEANALIQEIEKRPYLGYQLKKISFSNGPKKIFENKKERVDIVVISKELEKDSEITQTLYRALEARITFLDLASAYELICAKIPVSFVEKTWFLKNLREGEKMFYEKMKRIFDLIFAFFLLVVTSPLWAIIALLIKSYDRGKVFYKQKRMGKDKKPFYLWKFRSMEENAENGKAVWAKKNDPRVTPIGRMLRRTHLDELPQMLNVIKGEISLVGPRPERPVFVKKLENQIPHYHLRHLIKPGITGWDQIKFKYANSLIDSLEKFQYDLYYLKNRRLMLDFAILLKTFQSLFRKTN